jgi:hypothetical protein
MSKTAQYPKSFQQGHHHPQRNYQYNYQHNQHNHQHQHKSNYKTSICKYAKIGCKQRDTCWYAHNIDELRYRHCSSSSSCSNNDCPFVHGDTLPDKNVYYLRIILNSNIIGIDNNLITKELNILANREIKQKQIETYDKFIIELDDEEEEEEEEEEEKEKIDGILDELANLNIGKWGDYEPDDSDLDLLEYIETYTKKWNNKLERETFYDKKEETETKKDINMMVHVSDEEFNEIVKYLNSMNINYIKLNN